MNRLTPHFVFWVLLSGSACIENTRRATEGDTAIDTTPVDEVLGDVEPDTVEDTFKDTVAVDTAEVDTIELDTDDTNDALDTEDTEQDTEVVEHICLPAGCKTASENCAVAVGFCWVDGGCVPNDQRNPANTCQRCDSGVSPQAWRTLSDGWDCDDGVTCTTNDICRSGVCSGDTDCPGTLSCLTPVCDVQVNACVDTIDERRCFIAGRCMSDGEAGALRCARCAAEVSQTELTPGDGNEPDDTFEQANALTFNELAVTTGNDFDAGWNGPWTTSTLAPVLDVDSFTYEFTSAQGFTRPLVKVSRADTLQLEVCVYMRCKYEEGDVNRPLANVTCGGGDTKKTNGDWVGCCRNGTTLAQEYIPSGAWCERSGTKLTARAEVMTTLRRVVPPAQPECYPYTLRWGMR